MPDGSGLTLEERENLTKFGVEFRNREALEVIQNYYGRISKKIEADPNSDEKQTSVYPSSGCSALIVKSRKTPAALVFSLRSSEGILEDLNIVYSGNGSVDQPFRSVSIKPDGSCRIEKPVISGGQIGTTEVYEIKVGGKLDDRTAQAIKGIQPILDDFLGDGYESISQAGVNKPQERNFVNFLRGGLGKLVGRFKSSR